MASSPRRGRSRGALGLALASVVVTGSLSTAAAAFAEPSSAPAPARDVAGQMDPTIAPGGPAVVSGRPGSGAAGTTAAAAAVRAAGGTVLAELPLVNGVAADLPAGARLSGFAVAADRSLSVAAAPSQDTADGPASTARQTLGLTASSPSGHGVTVAVVDTGVDDVPDLAGRVLHVDVTGSRTGSSKGDGKADGKADGKSDGDGYGHGTFVAGLVAGDGHSSAGRYTGAAPAARLLDVRVAQADGSTSLVSVLRGLQVVAASADALHVKVLNLSLSSGSPLPYQVDPLTQALEALWRQGVTVVAAAGNDGPTPGRISSPGLDPTLLTAGALDEAGTADRADDTVADYSSRGPAAQGVGKPDLVAPGSHLVSLRAPGSTVDEQNPASRVGTSYFRGSGTSMSTALVSGVAADLLSARPDLTPDAVKRLLTETAYRNAALEDPSAAGAGGLDAAAALTAPTPPTAADPGASAGVPDPDRLSPAQVEAWNRFADALADDDRSAAFAAWNRLDPATRAAAMRAAAELSPEARSWVARSWVGRSWVGADGTADEWLARSWIARSWIARSWVARSWIARSWVARSWIARSWVARSWVGDDWAGRSWVGGSWTARSWIDSTWS